MDRRRQQISAKLRQAELDTLMLFGSLSDADQQAHVHGEGDAAWSAHDLLAHFVTIERSTHALFRNLIEGGAGTPEDFDLDRFNRSQVAKLADAGMGSLMRDFSQTRAETIRIIEAMADGDLDRQGRHAYLGDGTLEQFVKWVYEHTALHEAELREALANTK
jgi:hypothetical protein